MDYEKPYEAPVSRPVLLGARAEISRPTRRVHDHTDTYKMAVSENSGIGRGVVPDYPMTANANASLRKALQLIKETGCLLLIGNMWSTRRKL